MVRKIIKIDESKCDGCGLCAASCHEGAIKIIDSKAKLVREDYCDGLGNCLPVCPAGAISFETREAAVFNECASAAHVALAAQSAAQCCPQEARTISGESSLRQWPVQIKLVSVNAPFFTDAHLLVAADCCAYACGSFHHQYMKDKITIIGCSKLDNSDYTEKLTEILAWNHIESLTVVRMEVPCCSGIENAAAAALKQSGKTIPFKVFTLPVS